jgi:hypothetical protein
MRIFFNYLLDYHSASLRAKEAANAPQQYRHVVPGICLGEL